MKIDAGLSFELDKVADQAREIEAAGYDGALTFETSHDPFCLCCLQPNTPPGLS